MYILLQFKINKTKQNKKIALELLEEGSHLKMGEELDKQENENQ